MKNRFLIAKKIFSRTEIPVLAATLCLGVIFTAISPNFLSAYNVFNLSRTAALYMLMGLSQTCAIIEGGNNLSMGYIGGMACVMAGYVMQDLGGSGFIAIVLALLVGVLAGLFNGVMITKFKLAPFVVTLSSSFIFQGLITGFSQGFPYTDIPVSFTRIGRGSLFGLPYMLYLAVIILVLVWYMYKYTKIGRELLATGGNNTAAKMAAIPTDRCIIIGHILSGLFAALAGILNVSMNGVAQPSTGSDWMLYSMAVAVIGGTALSGGVINPIGLFIAGYMVIMIKNGLVMINANIYYELTYLGIILMLALSISSISGFIRESVRRRKFRQLSKRNI